MCVDCVYLLVSGLLIATIHKIKAQNEEAAHINRLSGGKKCIKTIKLQSKSDCFRFYCYPFQLMQKHIL